ncbi:MAG: tryptophan-rich sensory protein [Clostridia bacterium]|nr:tryptophan-rich sensory protein [Clostridia bacterium]
MVFKFNLKRFLISIAIPLIVGGLSALITSENMNLYSRIETPPLSPPGWIFPVVWTILYTLMGVSFYLVWNSNAAIFEKKQAFTIYAIQLFLNFIWSPIFFNMRAYLIAFIVLLALWGFVLAMIIKFYKISKLAGILQIPYLIWLTFAGYLNLAIYLLN